MTTQETVQYLEDRLQSNPKSLLFARLADFYIKQGRIDDAIGLCKSGVKHNPDYILWLDADQVYPGNTPEILMKHIDAGKSVVGGVSPLKKKFESGIAGKPSVWDLDIDAKLVRRREIFLNQGLIKVDAMGLGGIMVNPEIYKTMEYPWFRRMWNEKEKVLLSADFAFYANCKRANIDVWCDTDLVFGHIVTRAVIIEAAPEEEKK